MGLNISAFLSPRGPPWRRTWNLVGRSLESGVTRGESTLEFEIPGYLTWLADVPIQWQYMITWGKG